MHAQTCCVCVCVCVCVGVCEGVCVGVGGWVWVRVFVYVCADTHGMAQAQIAAKRRAETMAANQLKLLEERTELARKTLKIDYSSLGISSLPKVPRHPRLP